MRALAVVLGSLLLLIQYPLWLGKGGWLGVWALDRQVEAQRSVNARLRERNAALEGEVRDLAKGLLAIEERARYELGMIRPDEIFVQLAEPGSIAPEGTARTPAGVRRQGNASAAVAPVTAAPVTGAPATASPVTATRVSDVPGKRAPAAR
jgi:cell division protein FtsB